MRIEVISTYYREEFLAPLFMAHYETWADRVTLLTERMHHGKFDDHWKTSLINDAIRKSDADWVIVPDFDEFVFPLPQGSDPRAVLAAEPGDMMMCMMWRVWRHRTDTDVDRLKHPLPQRTHGQPDHQKPCIFRPRGVSVGIGVHDASFPVHYKWGNPWTAVHWANADPCFGIRRSREDRQARICPDQLASGLGVIPQWLQPGFLEQRYLQHLDDPPILTV